MLLRVFDARPGREPELLRRLQGIAASMIQRGSLDAVQICRYADSVDRIVWIEDRRAASGSEGVLEAEVAGTCADTLVQGPVSRPFELVDGFYHYPLPRCEVWSLEVPPASGPEEGVLTSFLELSRAASAEPSVAGMSVYRALGNPCGFLVFVALREGVTPSGGLFVSPTVALPGKWRRLRVIWTMGRLLSDPDPRAYAASGLYPRPTFWARSMPVLAVGPMREDS